MSATATEKTPTPATHPTRGSALPGGPGAAAPIPLGRVVSVELRKMFDTRSGFWLMASIVITAVLASAAVVLFAPDEAVTYDTFAAAIGVPITIILPIVAILSVTSEWSQRSGLTTFTLVPHRGRVVAAKGLATVLVAVVSVGVAFGVGAVGNLLGSAVNGTDTVWDMELTQVWAIPLANVLGLLLGFTFGLLLRSSAAAIVAYLVYALVLPPLAELLSVTQSWFADLRPWIDFNVARTVLFDQEPSAEQWANLATTTALWVVVPLVAGMLMLRRAEVK